MEAIAAVVSESDASGRAAPPVSAEGLARKLFALQAQRDLAGLLELLHADVSFAPRSMNGVTFHGRRETKRFFEQAFSWLVYEPVPSRYLMVSEHVVVATGRVRWSNDQDGLRDAPAAWLLRFRDGQLYELAVHGTEDEALALAQASTP